MMRTKIQLWDLNGFVYLSKHFIQYYEIKAKKYGLSKLSNRLNVTYSTVAFYRRQKLVSIRFLENVCSILKIDKVFAQESVVKFTQNLKDKYEIKFPMRLNPLHLREVSMILGDGTGSLDKPCRWSQNYPNILWDVKLIRKLLNFKVKYRPVDSRKCCVINIPKVLVESIAIFLNLKSTEIKSDEFFSKLCELPRKWQFQVFAQLVVDEGSPDNVFIVSQYHPAVKNGIICLLKNLGYQFSEIKNGIYIHTESFPLIQQDLRIAESTFGKIGGFWFKRDRFRDACIEINSEFSKNTRLYNSEFANIISNLKLLQKIFTYGELKKLVSMPEEALIRRINRSIKSKIILKIGYGMYVFSEHSNDTDVLQASLSKEEKILNVLSKTRRIRANKLLQETKLSKGSLFRGIKNLIDSGDIAKTDIWYHKID
jgi:hypothetical protein